MAVAGDSTAVFTADLIPTAAHVDVPWIMGYDLYPMETLEFKREIPARDESRLNRFKARFAQTRSWFLLWPQITKSAHWSQSPKWERFAGNEVFPEELVL